MADNSLEVHSLPTTVPGSKTGDEKDGVETEGKGEEEEEEEGKEEGESLVTRAAAWGFKTITTSHGTLAALGSLVKRVEFSGHRGEIRALTISLDGTLILSTSSSAAKVWNSKSGACLRTLPLITSSPESSASSSTIGLSCIFGPAARHAVIGCKDGSLKLFDLASGDLVEDNVSAHSGPIHALAVRPDGRGCVTGSSDKEVKFWDFDFSVPVQSKGNNGAPQLSLVHTRTLKLGDEVRALCYSKHTEPTRLLLAVALLDSTVKVFFEDTLKFSLSLYGHKLPVLSMDISADSTLLVTASSDKNVKLWGLDFGDCACTPL